jgi:NADH-quinone oxidoreductase subunit F
MESRNRLLPELIRLQEGAARNYLSPTALTELAARFGLKRAELRGVVSYYSMLSLRPRGRHVLRLCDSPVCRMLGSRDLLVLLEAELGVKEGGTSVDGLLTLEKCQCLGHCAGAPALMLDGSVIENLTSPIFASLLGRLRRGEPVASAHDAPAAARSAIARVTGGAIAFRDLDAIRPTDIDSYIAAGGYSALEKALSSGREASSAELEASGLRGRGGAGFPAATKGRGARQACEDCDRFIVCNADEGEPGTFKDRVIMEELPHRLIEGMIISAFLVGAPYGFIYVRGEYGLSIERLGRAKAEAEDRGYLGTEILGSDFSFELEIRSGAGSYLCGEELTLIESLEGRRGYPRIKPPFPAEAGFLGKPTLVNNVETLSLVPYIIGRGAAAFRALGTPGSPGTKIFCLSGDLVKPGAVEAEMGISLGDLIDSHGGGLQGGGAPAAVLLGGAAGTLVSGDMLGLRMDFDSLRDAGATLGSGAIIVLGPGRSVAEVISSIMDFFRHESCGKCVPCRVGTARLAAAGRRLEAAGAAERPEILAAMLAEAEAMAKTSLCPLGQSPVLSLASASRFLSGRIVAEARA